MKGVAKFLFALTLVIALGVVSTRTDILPGSMSAAVMRLQEQTTAVLEQIGADWAQIDLIGQKAVIRGVAPSQSMQDTTREAVAQAVWKGGLVLGGVTVVDASGVVIRPGPPRISPFVFSAERQGAQIVFSGYAPSEEAREAIYQLTVMRIRDAVLSGDVSIASGAPKESDWLRAISAGLQALALVEAGMLEARDTRLLIAAAVDSDEKKVQIDRLMSALPDGFSSAADITLAAAPALDETAGQQPATAQNCIDELRRLAGQTRISFATGGRAPYETDRAALNALAERLKACPAAVRLQITGHTDATGAGNFNLRLSLSRANAAASYLASLGVSQERLETQGRGAEDPIADNSTREGRAQNRRIEFSVIDETGPLAPTERPQP